MSWITSSEETGKRVSPFAGLISVGSLSTLLTQQVSCTVVLASVFAVPRCLRKCRQLGTWLLLRTSGFPVIKAEYSKWLSNAWVPLQISPKLLQCNLFNIYVWYTPCKVSYALAYGLYYPTLKKGHSHRRNTRSKIHMCISKDPLKGI